MSQVAAMNRSGSKSWFFRRVAAARLWPSRAAVRRAVCRTNPSAALTASTI